MSFDSGVFQCDTCPDYLDTEEEDLMAAKVIAQRKGWRTYKGPDKLWANSCPTCVRAFAQGRG